MIEEIMTLAHVMRLAATLLIGLRKDALQSHTHFVHKLACEVVGWNAISWSPIKSIKQAK